MTTTELITLLKKYEFGGATGRPREISFDYNGLFISTPNIEVESTGDGLITEICFSSKERKTGEWCADYDGYSDGEPVYDMWWCSECGTYFDEWDDRPTWKYCPNCGAKMSGGDEDEEPPKEE